MRGWAPPMKERVGIESVNVGVVPDQVKLALERLERAIDLGDVALQGGEKLVLVAEPKLDLVQPFAPHAHGLDDRRGVAGQLRKLAGSARGEIIP